MGFRFSTWLEPRHGSSAQAVRKGRRENGGKAFRGRPEGDTASSVW